MPFNSPKARAAFFEKLKQSGGQKLPMKPGAAPKPSNTLNKAPSMGSSMAPKMVPPVPGLKPIGPLDYMKQQSPSLKNVKFPKLKKFF